MSLLSVPLNVHVLDALREGPTPLTDLRRAAGSPPQTTLRGHIRTLHKAGILERRRDVEFPGSAEYELRSAGTNLLSVAEIASAWLEAAPDGPLQLGTPAGKSAMRALVDGWSTGLIRALAVKPLALTELNQLITGLSYPSIERRLGAMRLAGQIERCRSNGRRATPYAVTDWLRRAIAPLAAAALWERDDDSTETPPIKRLDIEAAFLLTVPLAEPASDCTGDCRMVVELRSRAGELKLADLTIRMVRGGIASLASGVQDRPQAWVSGSPAQWTRSLIDFEGGTLDTRGDADLAHAVLHALRAGVRLQPKSKRHNPVIY